MTTRRARLLLLAAILVYLIFVALIGFWKTPVDRPFDGTLDAWLAALHAHGVPNWVDYDTVEVTANIGFFVPIGLLLGLLLPARRWFMAIIAGAFASGVIELGQLLFLPARYASWSDIAANTCGAAVGVGIAALIRLATRRTRARALRSAA